MAIYHYKNSPLIDHVTIDIAHHGIARATIIAADNADAAEFDALRTQLGAQQFSTLIDKVDGRAAIQVRGLGEAKDLLGALSALGLAKGGITTELTPDDKKTVSFGDKVRGKAVFLSSIFYNLGNAAFLVSGVQRGRHNPDGKFHSHDISELLTGATFSVGDALMTFFGESKGDEELHAAAWGLKRHLNAKGIEIPQGDALNPDTLHQSGVMKATDRWLRKHIIHIKCLSEFTGGLFTIHAGMKRNASNQINAGKLTAGFLISTGWLATFLLDKQPGHHIFDDDLPEYPSLADKMAANPRGLIARPLGMGNNISNLWGSLNPKTGERGRLKSEVFDAQRQLKLNHTSENVNRLAYMQGKQHDYIWNVISACSFLVGHTLFGMSDTKRLTETDDDKLMMDDLVLLSANVLAKLPGPVRNISIGETAEYVSTLAHVRLTKAQVEAAIRDKVESLTQSTWIARTQAPDPGTAMPSPGAS